MDELDRPLALLIDGDNISYTLIRQIIEESSKYGQVMMKQVYGDWTLPEMQGWISQFQEFAITPIQVFRNRKGKNATDSALIIDAMDILHDDVIQGYCIATSDSDYTTLALRIKAHGKSVIGIGAESTHISFTNACTKFIKTENLVPITSDSTGKKSKKKVVSAVNDKSKNEQKRLKELSDSLVKAYDSLSATLSTVNLADLGDYMGKIEPGFDTRNYGCKKLADLIQKFPDLFEMERKQNQKIIITRKE
ncbi:MAG: NYN domain-containing protein [Methanomassiliicoccus sp.]|nr:MAG: NYN domain-containing protein [Methanomassiliicoccus sp.]